MLGRAPRERFGPKDAQARIADGLKRLSAIGAHDESILAISDEGEMVVAEPLEEVCRFADLDVRHADRGRGSKLPRNSHGLLDHRLPVIDSGTDVAKHPLESLDDSRLRLVREVAVHPKAHPRLRDGALRPGVIHVEVEDGKKVSLRIPLHDQLRMHDQPDESTLFGERGRDRVDKEWHVVGHDGCNGRKPVIVTSDDDIGRPRRPPSRKIPNERYLADYRRNADRSDILARNMPGKSGDEKPQLLVLFAF